eukprot:gene6452-8875_t
MSNFDFDEQEISFAIEESKRFANTSNRFAVLDTSNQAENTQRASIILNEDEEFAYVLELSKNDFGQQHMKYYGEIIESTTSTASNSSYNNHNQDGEIMSQRSSILPPLPYNLQKSPYEEEQLLLQALNDSFSSYFIDPTPSSNSNYKYNDNTATEIIDNTNHSHNSSTLTEEWEKASGSLKKNQSRRFIPCNDDIENLIMGYDSVHAKRIARESGDKSCSISFLQKSAVLSGQSCIVVKASNLNSLDKACLDIERRISDMLFNGDQKKFTDIRMPTSFASLHQLVPEGRRHIIVDNSNIFLNIPKPSSDPSEKPPRINVKNLVEIIRGTASFLLTNDEGKRVVAGSSPPPSNHPNCMWKLWEHEGFKVRKSQRDHDSHKEEYVDGYLVGEAYSLVGDCEDDAHGFNTMVVLTGDGNNNDGNASFIKVLIHAASKGWRVEVWSWKSSCSSKYISLSYGIPDGRFSIHYLDDYSDRILWFAKNNQRKGNVESNNQIKSNNNYQKSNYNHNPNQSQSNGSSNNRFQQNTDYINFSSHNIKNNQQAQKPPLSSSTSDIFCIICEENSRNYLIIPCKHVPCCYQCSEKLKKCPVQGCGKKIEKGMIIHLS